MVFSTEPERRNFSQHYGFQSLVPKWGCHVQHLPSLFSDLRANFLTHKKKRDNISKLSEPQSFLPQSQRSQQQMEPNSMNKLKCLRPANNQTQIYFRQTTNLPCDQHWARCSGYKDEEWRGTKVSTSSSLNQSCPNLDSPKQLHAHSGLHTPQSQQAKAKLFSD